MGNATEAVNAIEEVSEPELALMPVLRGQTVAKQCLANPHEFEDLEAWFIEKGLDAADVIWMLWVAMRNGTKVACFKCPHYNRAVVDQKGAKCIH